MLNEKKRLKPLDLPLTPRQAKLLAYISDRNNWRPPTFKQMCEHMGVTSDKTVRGYLNGINRRGIKI